MTYRVKEIFATLQGEGSNAGARAVFVRFVGCNLWTGDPRHRARDRARNDACCPEWCDTDFRDGETLDAATVASRVLTAAKEAGWVDLPLVVFTGGEPLLQLDERLCQELMERTSRFGEGPHPWANLAIETNGTVEAQPNVWPLIDHVCVSPKTLPHRLKVREGTELKVVFPSSIIDPDAYRQEFGDGFEQYWISPLAKAEADRAGMSVVDLDNMRLAVEYVMENPGWRLTLQAHKLLGLR